MSGAGATLVARGLKKSFGPTEVLIGLDLDVPASSLTAVLGPSGCGKTTLLRLVAGFDRPDAGALRLGDRDLAGPGVHVPAERRRIGLVPQEGALFPHLTVAANIGFGLPRRRRAARVAELLPLVDLDGLGKRYPHQLSGGQQQRVALARALAPTPEVILLDEPFDALDAGLRAQVRSEVRDVLRGTGTTALLVTHDQEEALSLADRVAVMREGKIVQVGDPRTVYREPVDLETARFLGDAVVIEGDLRNGTAATTLGPVPIRRSAGPQSGPVVVLLRPEQIVCRAGGSPGAPGRVLATEFYGHDSSRLIRLDEGGVEVIARTLGDQPVDVSDTVSVTVAGSGLAFEADPDGRRTLRR
jgi:iron(III) transport system ATP-binding protein